MNVKVLNRSLNFGSASNSARSACSILLLYARTARYLKPVQIYTRFLPRHKIERPYAALPLRPLTGEWLRPIPKNAAQTGPNRFRFLNQECEIRSWNDQCASKL